LVYDRIASGDTASVHMAKLAGVGGFSRTVALKMLHEPIASDPRHVAILLDEERLLSLEARRLPKVLRPYSLRPSSMSAA